ncbi:MAG: ParB/Srx family N-terminal domain-containing protein, partial [Nanoarchaeota archaeon]
MKIEKTTDYKMFKKLKGNRNIYKPHLNGLIQSIQEENLLQYNPITINSDMEIVDGQHRLEAAKILKLDIYYLVNP